MNNIHTYVDLMYTHTYTHTHTHLFTIYIIYHKYNFNTYLKIHPYVTIEKTSRMRLVWWLLWLTKHINLLMDENIAKIHPTNKLKFPIAAS